MIDSASFELRFQSLFDSARGFAFPCDPKGHVDLNRLSDRARNNLSVRPSHGRPRAFVPGRATGRA